MHTSRPGFPNSTDFPVVVVNLPKLASSSVGDIGAGLYNIKNVPQLFNPKTKT